MDFSGEVIMKSARILTRVLVSIEFRRKNYPRLDYVWKLGFIEFLKAYSER